jgi:hypothetical protein
MAELLVRAGAQDAALVDRTLAGPEPRPNRIVVDAHVAATTPSIAKAHSARRPWSPGPPDTNAASDGANAAIFLQRWSGGAAPG